MRDETKHLLLEMIERLRPDLSGDRKAWEASPLRDLIDSIMMLTLLCFLEDQFAITIHANDVTPEQFATIDSLSHFVENKRTSSHKD